MRRTDGKERSCVTAMAQLFGAPMIVEIEAFSGQRLAFSIQYCNIHWERDENCMCEIGTWENAVRYFRSFTPSRKFPIPRESVARRWLGNIVFKNTVSPGFPSDAHCIGPLAHHAHCTYCIMHIVHTRWLHAMHRCIVSARLLHVLSGASTFLEEWWDFVDNRHLIFFPSCIWQ